MVMRYSPKTGIDPITGNPEPGMAKNKEGEYVKYSAYVHQLARIRKLEETLERARQLSYLHVELLHPETSSNKQKEIIGSVRRRQMKSSTRLLHRIKAILLGGEEALSKEPALSLARTLVEDLPEKMKKIFGKKEEPSSEEKEAPVPVSVGEPVILPPATTGLPELDQEARKG